MKVQLWNRRKDILYIFIGEMLKMQTKTRYGKAVK